MQKDDRNPARDRELGLARLGLARPIPRRGFRNGLAARAGGVAASSLFPGFALAAGESSRRAPDAAGYDPPALGEGKFWRTAGTPIATRETYDLVVVGGGFGGLAAAYFHRAKNPPAPIRLVIRPAARCKNFRRAEATLSSAGGSNE